MSDTFIEAPATVVATKSVWRWIPTLYFGQGIPYVAVMIISVIFYKNMGVSNTDIALYTSWLYLPFVIKPLWSPFVDMFRTKRWWIVWLELLIGAAFALVALTIPGDNFFRITLAIFWLLAFSAATHDIASVIRKKLSPGIVKATKANAAPINSSSHTIHPRLVRNISTNGDHNGLITNGRYSQLV